jgi:hypothetical protein
VQQILMEDVRLLRSELRDCLARVRSVLVRAENALDKLQVMPLLPELHVGSMVHVDVCVACEEESSVVVDDDVVTEMMSKTSIEASVVEAPKESFDDGDDCIFGCFSPRATSSSPLQLAMPVASQPEDIVVTMAPVMRIMPELQNLCGEPSPLSMVQHRLDSLGTSSVVSTPSLVDLSQSLDFVDRGVKVNEAGALAPKFEAALFAEELRSLLVSLEAAIPGSGKEIASLLTDKATMGGIKKVKEYLRRISKKSGASKKAPKVD